MRSQTFDLLTPQPFGRDPTSSPFDDVFSDGGRFPPMSLLQGMRRQVFHLLTLGHG